ncbi:hypothetical protein CCMSSC00406_0003560 [Pleurotus cornucopiae]|uniref:Uncharacterized protein n=1 Tax=Pleurotus cornucopiae TaxID=5321 RepID=A0ACB7IIQ4_PLECO|nr:hypothetical protein CCMSSC00406_0003560 [Pleurotus cornucopiae]
MSPSLPPRAPGRFRKFLRYTKLKLLYARITATPCITLFSILSLITSIVLIVLQGITFRDNTMAVTLTSAMLAAGRVDGFPVYDGKSLEICTVSNGTTTCSVVPAIKDPEEALENKLFGGLNATELNKALDGLISSSQSQFSKRSGLDISPVFDQNRLNGVRVGETVLSLKCVESFVWINDTLKDAKREDLVTLAFHAWVFVMMVLTVVNESIPHLVASLAACILGTAWAGARIQTAKSWHWMYRRYIMLGSCDGTDLLGDWFKLRARPAIPIVFINALSTFAFLYLSISIYKTYSKRTIARAGASKKVQRIYKFALLFSASLNLAAFFNVVSASIWIDKVSSSALRGIADHIQVYQALFIVSLLLEFPWLISGWMSVRKESRLLFVFFMGVGIVPFAIATVMFTSEVYGFIFHTWTFFATVTITSYAFTITTLFIGAFCRTQFGKGLAHFLQVEQALEQLDFTPVYLSKDLEARSTDDRFSFSGAMPFPDTDTKRIRAVPSLSMMWNNDARSEKSASGAESIFTVPGSRRGSSQTVLDLRELPRHPSYASSTSRRPPTLSTRHESVASSILEVSEKPPTLAPISPLSSFHDTKSVRRGPSNLSQQVTASSYSKAGPARPPGLGLPVSPAQAVRPALSRRSAAPVRPLPSSFSPEPQMPLPPLPSPPSSQQG